ncbi:MAG: hypothetical protein NPIRA06_14440 [Nitrospirales bacterium]|nr:MAG: hypothetical protein NPIRA06_14440 [Nitrospirales bacterium]
MLFYESGERPMGERILVVDEQETIIPFIHDGLGKIKFKLTILLERAGGTYGP